jgi:nucleotide-binding universal stress UspA family protein
MTEHHTPTGYRTIVVGCDGSPQSDDALVLAQQLLDRERGRLVLVNVFPFYRGYAMATPGLYATLLRERSEITLQEAERRLDADVQRTLLPLSDSSVPRGINQVAEGEHADLIVLGSTHRSALGRAAGRTTVQRLLHGAPCAVAVAAPDQRSRPGRLTTIGVAYDGSPEAEAALEVAYGLARRDGARVRVCRAVEVIEIRSSYIVIDDEERYREAAQLHAEADADEAVALAPEGVEAERRVPVGIPAAAVVDACAGADLIVTGSRGYGPAHRVLAGGTALGIVGHAHLPVLIVPRPAEAKADAVALAAAREAS